MGIFVVEAVREDRGLVQLHGTIIKGVLKPGMEAVLDSHVIALHRVYDQDDSELEEATRGWQVHLEIDTEATWAWLQDLQGRQMTFTEDKKQTNSLAWDAETISS